MKEASKKTAAQSVRQPIHLSLDAEKASGLKELPNGKFLTREFIHNSLYHPSYGYFSRQARVFSPPNSIFKDKIDNNDQFLHKVSKLYKDKEMTEPRGQLWHTPTELFQPFYGHAIARCILEQAKSQNKTIKIVEIGAGNGTLMKNIMEYLQVYEPQYFDSATYSIIEISSALASCQSRLLSTLSSSIQARVIIHNQNSLALTEQSNDHHFVVALEVLVSSQV